MSRINVRQSVAVFMGAIAAAIAISTTPAYAEDELTQIFADVPLTLQLKTLDSSWKRLSLNQESLAPSILFGISGMLESALRTNIYYTQGQTVAIRKQQYLVVYRPEGSNISLTDMLQSSPKRSPESLIKELSPNSKLILSLINLSKLDSLQDIQSFNLQKEIKESKQVLPKQLEKTEKPVSPSTPTVPSTN